MLTRNQIVNILIFLFFMLVPFDWICHVNSTTTTTNNNLTLNNRDWPQLRNSDNVPNNPAWVRGSSTTQSPRNIGQPTNRRDFVNTNRPSAYNTNQKQVNNQFIASQRNDGANVNSKRDFVNPKPAAVQNSNKNQQNNQGHVLDPSAWPQLGGGKRDFANTNTATTWMRSTTKNPVTSNTKPNSNSRRDYVNPNVKPQANQLNANKDGQNTPNLNVLPKPTASTTSTGPNINSGKKNQPMNNEDDELREFSEALLRKDTNNAGKFITVNYQGRTTSRSLVDEAPQPLLTLRPEIFNISTVSLLVPLHNNYILESAENEYVTPQERTEENNLLDEMLATSVMQHARNFLIQKGKIGKDPKEFRDLLKRVWFNMYSRGGGKIGSSGFEHVFLAEIKNGEVSGLHNWLYFNMQEMSNKVNYLGYMKKIDLMNKGALIKFHFKFGDIDKPVASMFIGTSPELEIALYTTCFLLRPDTVCPLRLDGNNFIIRTYTYRYRGKNLIGSAFPEI